jgi:hypothetical protein
MSGPPDAQKHTWQPPPPADRDPLAEALTEEWERGVRHLVAEIQQLREQLRLALALHQPVTVTGMRLDPNGGLTPYELGGVMGCEHCDRPWPCATARALGVEGQ